MHHGRGTVGVVLVALGFFGCGESVIQFVSLAHDAPIADSGTPPTSATSGLGVGGASIGSGGASIGGGGISIGSGGVSIGTGGASIIDAATSQDAGSVPCPIDSNATHALDVIADALASTATHLYWLDANKAVMRQPKAMGAAETLSSMDGRGTLIHVDDTRVFWDEDHNDGFWSVYGMPVDGSGGHVQLCPRVRRWAVGADRVFCWRPSMVDAGGSLGDVVAVPKGGGAPALVVADALAVGPAAADETGIYWYDGRADAGFAFEKFTFATSMQTRFNMPTMVRYLVAGQGHILWSDENGFLEEGEIRWAPPGGNPVSTIATGQPYLLGLAIDATTAYWLTGTRTGSMGPADVVASPLAGGQLRKLACNLNMPRALMVDDEAAYVSTAAGVVFKIGKNPL